MKPRIRKAFVMSINPGTDEQYVRRHNPIWPELEDLFRQQGVHNYSIYLHQGTHQLFAFVEIEDEARWAAIAEHAICKKWWAYMRELMPTNPDGSPESALLREVFHFD